MSRLKKIDIGKEVDLYHEIIEVTNAQSEAIKSITRILFRIELNIPHEGFVEDVETNIEKLKSLIGEEE